MSSSCRGLMEQFVQCLINSDCVKSGKSAKECASLAEECQGLRNSFFRCKKGQADPRSRIQGQKGF